ncbi:hypothetical protein F3Y22_tig00110528pilonHSYRG00375 [Hibiscus syriacus]|uniref:Uncharacterized protein n=1 Tax=Hibiscus syriacus TaxID=106335 RepID=A0A6A3ACK9_HIBSY|nr:hypothetical protein F3Y22_tig00110528pilonHSYRG00375 [Hibiscus syriacus]
MPRLFSFIVNNKREWPPLSSGRRVREAGSWPSSVGCWWPEASVRDLLFVVEWIRSSVGARFLALLATERGRERIASVSSSCDGCSSVNGHEASMGGPAGGDRVEFVKLAKLLAVYVKHGVSNYTPGPPSFNMFTLCLSHISLVVVHDETLSYSSGPSAKYDMDDFGVELEHSCLSFTPQSWVGSWPSSVGCWWPELSVWGLGRKKREGNSSAHLDPLVAFFDRFRLRSEICYSLLSGQGGGRRWGSFFSPLGRRTGKRNGGRRGRAGWGDRVVFVKLAKLLAVYVKHGGSNHTSGPPSFSMFTLWSLSGLSHISLVVVHDETLPYSSGPSAKYDMDDFGVELEHSCLSFTPQTWLASLKKGYLLTGIESRTKSKFEAPAIDDLNIDVTLSRSTQERGWKEGSRPIVGLDGCFLKVPFKGILLSAVRKDADLGLDDGFGYTIISDQHKV